MQSAPFDAIFPWELYPCLGRRICSDPPPSPARLFTPAIRNEELSVVPRLRAVFSCRGLCMTLVYTTAELCKNLLSHAIYVVLMR